MTARDPFAPALTPLTWRDAIGAFVILMIVLAGISPSCRTNGAAMAADGQTVADAE